MKKLTIITICYNIVSTIKRTCESIVNQTFQDFEWIVVDGGSTDGTVDILKTYSSRIDILISEPDKGIYNAMNKGTKLATGEYVNFMNGGDEFYDNEVLEKVFKNKEYNADVIYGDELKIKEEQTYLFKNWEKITKNILFERYAISHQASFTKTSLMKKYGFDEKYKISADFNLFVKILNKGYLFKKIPIIINKFYEDGISSQNEEIRRKEYYDIKKKNFNLKFFMQEHPQIKKNIIFLSNSITHPRYFAGWIKRKIIK